MFYLHIPKTGGQTLARRLASAFPLGRAHLQAGQFTFPTDCNVFSESLSAHDFVEGHVTGELMGGREIVDLLVTVREPVAQIISNYRHIRREPDRRLSRAARELAPDAFFNHFGDFFTDFQTRYLLSAFIPLGVEEQRDGFWQCASHHLPLVLKHVRWLVPTDRIDGFIPLWEAETGRRAAERDYATNHAPADGVNLSVLEAAIRARPSQFALDNVLYQYACSHFADWTAAVQQKIAPWHYPANASRVYYAGNAGIWLRRGWHSSEPTPHGLGNWAGPTTRSDITLLRDGDLDTLSFDALVVNGITFDDIRAYDNTEFTELPMTKQQLASDHWRYRIDLAGLPSACGIALMVPDCFADINVFDSRQNGDLMRRSFLAANWTLTKDTVDRTLPEPMAEIAGPLP